MDGKPYIRMEYIKRYTVEELRNREGNMSFSRSAIVILHILAGLKHAHEHGVIHRDLRPRNVIFSENESVRVCKNAVSRAAKKAIIAGIL